MPSLGSLATDAVKGMNTYPVLLIAPALMISIMILVSTCSATVCAMRLTRSSRAKEGRRSNMSENS